MSNIYPWIIPISPIIDVKETHPLPSQKTVLALPQIKETNLLPKGLSIDQVAKITEKERKKIGKFRQVNMSSYCCPKCDNNLWFCYEILNDNTYKRYNCINCNDYELIVNVFRD